MANWVSDLELNTVKTAAQIEEVPLNRAQTPFQAQIVETRAKTPVFGQFSYQIPIDSENPTSLLENQKKIIYNQYLLGKKLKKIICCLYCSISFIAIGTLIGIFILGSGIYFFINYWH